MDDKTASATPKPGRRRWPVVLLSSISVISSGWLVLVLAASEPAVGRFRTPEGRQAHLDAYDEALDLLPTPRAAMDVPTSFGTVRAYVWVNLDFPDANPVVLLPGRTSGAPMWVKNLADLAAHRTVYAFDALGDSGLSVQTIPLRDMVDQAAWVHEVIAALGIAEAHIVGHSFGGATAAAVALHHPDRVVTLTLLEPVFTLRQPPNWVWPWVIVGSLPFMPQEWRDHALNKIGGAEKDETDPDDPTRRMIAAGVEHFKAELPNPSPLSEDELKKLAMPVYVGLASTDSLAGDGAADRAALIPDVQVKIWPKTTHSLPFQAASELDDELEAFWAAHP